MNNKNTKNNILHKIMVLLVVFSMAVIDTVPLWVNTIAVTKEEVPTEGLQEGNKEEELTEEELTEEDLVEEELVEEELVEEELEEEELVEEELVEEELVEEELVEEELVVEEELMNTDEDFKYVPYIEDVQEKEGKIEVTYKDGETIEVQDSDIHRRARVVFKGSTEEDIDENTEKLAEYLLSLSTETIENEGYIFDEKEGLTETLIKQWEEVLELDKNGVEKDNLEKLEGLMDTVQEFTLFGKDEEVKEELVEEELVEEELVKEELVKEELVKEELVKEELVKEDEVKEELVKEELVEEGLVKEDEELTKADKETNIGKGMLTTPFGTKLKSNLMSTNEAMDARTMTATFGTKLNSNLMSTNETMVARPMTTTFGTKLKSNLMSTNGAMVARTMMATTTPTYVLAKDSDFSGTTDGNFRYIGTDEYVVIPHVIKGVNVTSYRNMFNGTSVKGVASTNKNVTDMRQMFYESQATSLDLSSFDTSKVTYMRSMFYESQATSLDLSSFDTSKVTDMRQMFYESQATSLDLSSFDTSKVTDMRQMFYESQATSLDLSNFDTSNVTNMGWMFNNSQATIGYARTKVDADIFNGTSNKPSALTFYVYEGDAPTGTITGKPTTWTNQNITLTFNATDASGG